ncbi:MAG: MerR family transcriptional regulator [Acidimicrobiia bacterium]|nr:MerR family transcriptional regulator [Acidimicrobiia bacterium]
MAMSEEDPAAGRSIGEVIAELRTEFPELSVSKVRFLEGQGLVEPDRSPSGYRLFSDAEVERIRYILRQQRDHYLPLKVIRSKLAGWDAGDRAPAPEDAAPPPEVFFGASGVSMTADELCRSAGLSRQQLRALVDQSLIEPMVLPDDTEVYRDDALPIARAARRLLAEGLEIRHLRTLRLAAERQAELLRQLVTPLLRHRNPDSRRKAAEILAASATAADQLESGMVRSRLRSLLES